MPKISEWLATTTAKLSQAGITSARLDAEIILAHTLKKSRTFLHAHGEIEIEPRDYEIAEARASLRCDRTPIAYIIGHKEFYGRQFKVTPATLIPRPESETLIELLKKVCGNEQLDLIAPGSKYLIDVGTGSGCLGVTAKLELPFLDVTVSDISNHALKVAETNAKQLHADVRLLHSDLLTQYPFVPDFILANLPYVGKTWDRSPETEYEPELALFAEDDGLHLINKLIDQSISRLNSKGRLFLEADPRQHEDILTQAKRAGFRHVESSGLIVQFRKD